MFCGTSALGAAILRSDFLLGTISTFSCDSAWFCSRYTKWLGLFSDGERLDYSSHSSPRLERARIWPLDFEVLGYGFLLPYCVRAKDENRSDAPELMPIRFMFAIMAWIAKLLRRLTSGIREPDSYFFHISNDEPRKNIP